MIETLIMSQPRQGKNYVIFFLIKLKSFLTHFIRFTGNKNPFMRLFGYIQGANDKKEKINMTVPVINKKDSTSSSIEMSFFIPFAQQANPPRPTASDVYIENMRPLCVYVRSFGGWMWLSGRSNYAELKNALRNDGLENSYSKNYYYTAGYDSPWKIRNRHNEIWFIKL